jgi:DNA-dependent RNA polymerase
LAIANAESGPNRFHREPQSGRATGERDVANTVKVSSKTRSNSAVVSRARRHRAASQRAEEELGRLESTGEAPPWLPMPFESDSASVSDEERKVYCGRRGHHHALEPAYAAGWRRPTPQTANRVWDLLADRLKRTPESLLPQSTKAWELSANEQAELVLTAKQALAVTLAACVHSAGHHSATLNLVFDALASRWSDNFRLSSATTVRDMWIETAQAARRDLLRNGIDLQKVWDIATGDWSRQSAKSDRAHQNPLYFVREVFQGAGKRVYRTYSVTLHRDTEEYKQFRQLLTSDAALQDVHGWQLLLDREEPSRYEPRQELCAEQPYNVVSLDPRARRVLALQQQTRLLFDVEEFHADYRKYEGSRKSLRKFVQTYYSFDPEDKWQLWSVTDEEERGAVKNIREVYEAADIKRRAFEAVHEQMTSLDHGEFSSIGGKKYLPIKSGFFCALNRRYQPTHFWPSSVSNRPDRTHIPDDRTTPRTRWFKFVPDGTGAPADLHGRDVSSSQTQILAYLLGLEDLEEIASGAGAFNHFLAKHAFNEHGDKLHTGWPGCPAYADENDARLVLMVKNFWMRVLYGSRPEEVIYDQAKESRRYGPGWQDASLAKAFLEDLPWYADTEENGLKRFGVRTFLDACRHIARKSGRYEGVTFIDPLDRIEFRWNPVQRADYELPSRGQKLTLSLPGRIVRTGWHRVDNKQVGSKWEFKRNVPNTSGDYPTDPGTLEQMVAPCLVHCLDAYFAALVIERLTKRGIRDFVSVHDCWYVRESDLPTLNECIDEASEEWFAGLKPVYKRLHYYLGSDPGYKDFVENIWKKWNARRKPVRFATKS